MAKVKIVYVPDKELRGPDLERIGGVEDVPDELARIMVAGGEAVWADADADEPAAKVAATAADPASAPIKATPAPKTDAQ